MKRPTEEEYQEAALLWHEQNKDKDYIPQKAVVTLPNGKVIKIGERISRIRNGKVKVAEKNVGFWEKEGAFASPITTEEEYQEAALLWHEQNKDKDYIPQNAVVTLPNGKVVQIGARIRRIKQGGVKVAEKDEGFWEKEGAFTRRKTTATEEEYQEAALLWHDQNKDKDHIPRTAVVTLPNGKAIRIGERISRIEYGQVKVPEENMEFWLDFIGTKKKKASTKPKMTTLEKYTELFNGDKEKANRVVSCLQNLREKNAKKKKTEWNIDNLLSEFDINVDTLINILNKTKKEKAVKKKDEPLSYQKKSLRQFCIEQGYNYEVIERAVRLHPFCESDSMEQLINRVITTYQKEGQQAPSTWIYEKYGMVVKHVLIYLHLDTSAILKNMSDKIISLEEAIRHEVFVKTRKEKENAWLEEPYEYLIAELSSEQDQEKQEKALVDKFSELVVEYKLEPKEYQILWNALSGYVKTIKEYQIADVGLTRKEEEKLTKIKAYNLEELDIEESYFVPLHFDKGVLLGQASKKYKRRNMIRQYTIDWDIYEKEEKEAIIRKEKINEKELYYITTTRQAINKMCERAKEVPTKRYHLKR